MTKKKTPIEAAKALLEKNGYTVKAIRPDPKIGDVVRTYEDDGSYNDVLITFREIDNSAHGDGFEFGGVAVSEAKREDQYPDMLWIDSAKWAKDDGQYQVIGHVDLSKFTNTSKLTLP